VRAISEVEHECYNAPRSPHNYRGAVMVCERRKWSSDSDCLYTDDRRVKDLAVTSNDMRIVARYFRTPEERHPFAWDIIAPRDVIADVEARYGRR